MIFRNAITLLLAVIVFAMASTPSATFADDCVKIETTPQFSTLSLFGDLVSSTEAPGLYCTLEPGRTYRMTVSYPNHERRSLKLRFNGLGESPTLSGMRLSHLARSMILPGWGQDDMGYRPRAVMAFTSVATGALKASQAYGHYKNEQDLHNFYLTVLAEDNTDTETAARAEHSRRNVEAHEEHLMFTAGVGGYLYFWNLVEAVLLSTPPGKKTTDSGAIILEIPGRSKARAAIRSFFFPGLGQKYYGGDSRGVLYQVLFVTGVYGTLDAKMRYDLREIAYDLDKSAAAKDPSNTELQLAAEISRESRDDTRKQLEIWGVTTAGIWAISLIDAIVRGDSGGSAVKPGRLQMTSDYRGGVMRAGLGFHF